METARPVAAWAAQQSRPGRRVLVVSDLADLRGPAEGTAELPGRLFWSSPDRTFDLGKPFMVRAMYETVLGQARRPEDLTTYLNSAMLISVWPELYLPKGIRAAWEERHPVLRTAAAAA
ncbi:MAG TPA: hypothetical protein VGM53_35230 [Streptosporangiaceae bacterium]|jgi:hypothetical protein